MWKTISIATALLLCIESKAQSTSTWLGITSNLHADLNWLNGVPSSTTDVVIPLGLSLYPQMLSGQLEVHNVTVLAANGLKLLNNARLKVHGTLSGTGTIDAAQGIIELAGAGSVINGSTLKHHAVNHLVISATASIGTASIEYVRVTGKLQFNGSDNVFNTNGNLVIASSASGDGSVAALTLNEEGGTISNNVISGDVTVERYVSEGRKWRFLAINTETAQTIKQAWMEDNSPGGNTNAGYGTRITDPSGTPQNFDGSSVAPSMKYWDGLAYTGVANPATTEIGAQDSYMLFVRGDRSITPAGTATNTTVLRTKGPLRQGVFPLIPSIVDTQRLLTPIANPYASAIDLSKAVWLLGTSQPVQIQVWDPKLTGIYGVGGFQTLTRAAGQLHFRISPGGGSYSPLTSGDVMDVIESGQSFYVQSGLLPNSIQFTEVTKTRGEHLASFSSFTRGHEQNIFGRLYIHDINGNTDTDGFAVYTDDAYQTAPNNEDARKTGNTSESVSVKQGDALLAVNMRKPMQANDSIQINLTGVRYADYLWEIDMRNMDAPGRSAVLIDKFLNTQTPLSPAGVTHYNFSITAPAASWAADRFLIVFRPAGVLALTQLPAPQAARSTPLNSFISISPNPVENKVAHMQFNRIHKGIYDLRVSDETGRMVYKQKFSISGPQQTEDITLLKAAKGVYVVTVTKSGAKVYQEKIVVL